jgi:maleate isomerase
MRIGVLTPHAAVGPEDELPAMASGRVAVRVVRGLSAPTAEPLLDRAADELRKDSPDAVAYASTTSAYTTGFCAEARMIARFQRRVGVPVVATGQSAVLALRVLAVDRVALIGAPWFDASMNELGAVYFRSQGFDVVSSESAALSQDPTRIEPDDVYEWASQHVADAAQGVFIGGNGFRTARAIARLELALQRPVVTANQVLLWNALQPVSERYEIRGYGRLLEQTVGSGSE